MLVETMSTAEFMGLPHDGTLPPINMSGVPLLGYGSGRSWKELQNLVRLWLPGASLYTDADGEVTIATGLSGSERGILLNAPDW